MFAGAQLPQGTRCFPIENKLWEVMKEEKTQAEGGFTVYGHTALSLAPENSFTSTYMDNLYSEHWYFNNPMWNPDLFLNSFLNIYTHTLFYFIFWFSDHCCCLFSSRCPVRDCSIPQYRRGHSVFVPYMWFMHFAFFLLKPEVFLTLWYILVPAHRPCHISFYLHITHTTGNSLVTNVHIKLFLWVASTATTHYTICLMSFPYTAAGNCVSKMPPQRFGVWLLTKFDGASLPNVMVSHWLWSGC